MGVLKDGLCAYADAGCLPGIRIRHTLCRAILQGRANRPSLQNTHGMSTSVLSA